MVKPGNCPWQLQLSSWYCHSRQEENPWYLSDRRIVFLCVIKMKLVQEIKDYKHFVKYLLPCLCMYIKSVLYFIQYVDLLLGDVLCICRPPSAVV